MIVYEAEQLVSGFDGRKDKAQVSTASKWPIIRQISHPSDRDDESTRWIVCPRAPRDVQVIKIYKTVSFPIPMPNKILQQINHLRTIETRLIPIKN